MVEVSIILVNYNTGTMTSQAIQSIKNACKSVSYEIIVVDNHSQDDSVQIIKNTHPDVILVKEDKNYGYGRAVNDGAKKANGTYLLILNSDIYIENDYLHHLIQFVQERKAGIVGIKLLLPNGNLQKSFGFFPSPMLVISNELPILRKIKYKHFNRYAIIENENPPTQKVDWVTGAFMFVAKKHFRSVNGFDEKIFMYYEDVDLCRRMYQKGLANYFVSEYTAVHRHCATMKSIKQYPYNFFKVKERQSALYYLKKYYPSAIPVVKAILLIIFSYKTFIQFLKYLIFAKTKKSAKNRRKLETNKQIIQMILSFR